MIRALTLFLCLIGTAALSESMKLAVTTSFHNSGLSDVLLPVLLVQNNSVEKYLLSSLPMDNTLTSSPYFSPNNAKAPFSTASLGVISLVFTSDFFSTIKFTYFSIVSISFDILRMAQPKVTQSLIGLMKKVMEIHWCKSLVLLPKMMDVMLHLLKHLQFHR